MRDEVGQAPEQTAAQFTLEDGVHLPQQHVSQLAGACGTKISSSDYPQCFQTSSYNTYMYIQNIVKCHQNPNHEIISFRLA